MKVFKNVDIIKTLRSIMKVNTKHYQTDFDYDVDFILDVAKNKNIIDKTIIWTTRHTGTHCFLERNSFIYGTYGNDVIKHEVKEKSAKIYAIELTCISEDGNVIYNNEKLKGNIYEVDYKEYYETVKKYSQPIDAVILHFQSEESLYVPYEEYKKMEKSIENEYGKIETIKYVVEDKEQENIVLYDIRLARQKKAVEYDINKYINKLINETDIIIDIDN